MKHLLAILACLTLNACVQESVLGLNFEQRMRLYELAAATTGHPEAAPIIYGVRRAVTSAKQPVDVNPEPDGLKPELRTQKP